MTRIDIEAKSDRELLIMMNQQLQHHSEKHEELKVSVTAIQTNVHKLQEDLYIRKGLHKAWALIVTLASFVGIILGYNK
jgi:hypothetical protein